MSERISVKKMLNMAQSFALSDRESLLDCFGHCSEEDKKPILEDIEMLNAWEYKNYKRWNEEDKDNAFKILLWAEQWEEGYKASKPGKEYEGAANANIERMRAFRWKHLGRSKLENILPDTVSVDIVTLMKNTPPTPG